MNNTLSCVKGDALNFNVNLTDLDGNEYVLASGEFLTFKVKQNPWDTVTLLQETSTDGTFSISDIDLEAGSYFFEISITFSDSTVLTVIPASRSRLNVDFEL